MEVYKEMHSGILGCNLLWSLFPPPPQSQPAKWWLQPLRSRCQREPSCPALCVRLSVGDRIRRCSSITDRAVVCTVALVWEQEGGD